MKTYSLKGIFLSVLLMFAFTKPNAKTSKSNAVPAHDSITLQTSGNNRPADMIPLQPAVKNFVGDYLEENSEMLENLKQKNSSSFKIIERILEQRGIPAELKYLAVVESKLKNTATSGAGAAGVWQLMPVTARSLGLKVNGKADERRNIYKSSAAAANYLSVLYNEFDDWLLVIAAYNCGAGNVYKAIKKSGSRDFWKLQFFLPAETRKHVKKFIATHFYYEENGSLVTLTKNETKKHIAAQSKAMLQEAETKIQPLTLNGINCINWVLIRHENGELIADPRK